MFNNTTADNVFQAMQILLSAAPVPGLAAAAIVVQEVGGLSKSRFFSYPIFLS